MEMVPARYNAVDAPVIGQECIDVFPLILDLHFAELLEVVALLPCSGLPERTFNRRSRERYLHSLRSFLIDKHIEVSCRLLHEAHQNVYEIAHQ